MSILWKMRGRGSGKTSPGEWVLIGLGIAGLQLLTRGGFEPFSLLAFLLAAQFERVFKYLRYSNWLSIGCGLVLALGIQFWVIDFKVVKHDLMAPTIQKHARVFYQPAFFRLQPRDRVLFKSVRKPSPTTLSVGQIRRIAGRSSYEVVRLADNQATWVTRDQLKGKVLYILNPSQTADRRD